MVEHRSDVGSLEAGEARIYREHLRGLRHRSFGVCLLKHFRQVDKVDLFVGHLLDAGVEHDLAEGATQSDGFGAGGEELLDSCV